jgi:two-component system, LytTR family, sensor kinase
VKTPHRQIPFDWRLVPFAWTLYAIFMTTQSYVVNLRAGRPISVVEAVVNDFSYAGLWALLTPLVFFLARRFPLERTSFKKHVWIHLAASFAVALLHKGVHNVLLAALYFVSSGREFSWDLQVRNLIAYFDYGIPLYWILVLLQYGFDYYSRFQEKELRAAQLESQLAQAQLQALKMQLHPHFLFNTLNAISVLIQKDPPLAKRTVGRLSELLRYTLDNMGVQHVSLEEELEFLDRYLQIEKTRFGDRLKVSIEVDDELKSASVPNMILQPLVENAIKHGISRKRGDALIEVKASRMNGTLCLQVIDNGVGIETPSDRKDGVGLSTTRARLQEMYGDAQTFALENLGSGGAQATVTLPFIHFGKSGE